MRKSHNTLITNLNTPVSEEGLRYAAEVMGPALAKELTEFRKHYPSALISVDLSPTRRVFSGWKAMEPSLKTLGLIPPRILYVLRDLDKGALHGLTPEERQKQYHDYVAELEFLRTHYKGMDIFVPPPGQSGESVYDMHTRIMQEYLHPLKAALANASVTNHAHIIFGHGLACKLMRMDFTGIALSELENMRHPPGGICKLSGPTINYMQDHGFINADMFTRLGERAVRGVPGKG